MKNRRFSLFRIGLALSALLLILPAGFVQGIYFTRDLVNIPVERLIKNLEAIAKSDPNNVQVRFNLARAHAMAYALKTETAPSIKDREDQSSWFNMKSNREQFSDVQTGNEAEARVAKAHLPKAIERYEEVLGMEPNNMMALLGHAWCIGQSGDKERAIRELRLVVVAAWAIEKNMRQAPLGWLPVTAEAAGYLIPLLDENKDRVEIDDLRDRIKITNSIPRPITPIAIPLRNNLTASDLEDRSAQVAFDADGTGLKKSWTWITDDAGWLVYDPHGTGRIDSALQLFGSVTFWMFWQNGYQALAALDDDRNGMLEGGELRGLAIWQDVNGDGISDRGEVKPLEVWGIVGISCKYVRDLKHPDRIVYSPGGVLFRDGSSRSSYDLILHDQREMTLSLHLGM